MNNYERLEGMVAATFTPMDENGDVNLSVIDKYADWIASTPVKGVFVCGTTGEFSSLTIDERKAVLEKWVASAAKRFKETQWNWQATRHKLELMLSLQ